MNRIEMDDLAQQPSKDDRFVLGVVDPDSAGDVDAASTNAGQNDAQLALVAMLGSETRDRYLPTSKRNGSISPRIVQQRAFFA